MSYGHNSCNAFALSESNFGVFVERGGRFYMEQKIYLDGEFVSRQEAKISVFDHGLLYGDGVFEGLRSYSGRIFKLYEHLDRLYKSAQHILLTIPLSREELAKTIIKAMRINGLKDAYIRVVVTRGVGDLGLDPTKCPKSSLFVIADKIKLYPEEFYQKGLEIITVPTQRTSIGALDPRVKSLNYLNNILAKIEALNAGVKEALMLNAQGLALECTGDNIFLLEEEILKTPPTYLGILNGITRQTTIELAKSLSIKVEETILSRYNLFNAEECFLTGTAAEIIPVVKIDNRVIGNGKPGPITDKIRNAFKEFRSKEGTLVY